jgi:hypothetical protein
MTQGEKIATDDTGRTYAQSRGGTGRDRGKCRADFCRHGRHYPRPHRDYHRQLDDGRDRARHCRRRILGARILIPFANGHFTLAGIEPPPLGKMIEKAVELASAHCGKYALSPASWQSVALRAKTEQNVRQML